MEKRNAFTNDLLEIGQRANNPNEKTKIDECLSKFKTEAAQKEKTLSELVQESQIPVVIAPIKKEWQQEMERIKENGCAYFFESEEEETDSLSE